MFFVCSSLQPSRDRQLLWNQQCSTPGPDLWGLWILHRPRGNSLCSNKLLCVFLLSLGSSLFLLLPSMHNVQHKHLHTLYIPDMIFAKNNTTNITLPLFIPLCMCCVRQVTLDLLQFENVAVRRVLRTEEGLVNKLRVTEFPSCYLYYPGGNFTRLKVWVPLLTLNCWITTCSTFYCFSQPCLPTWTSYTNVPGRTCI